MKKNGYCPICGLPLSLGKHDVYIDSIEKCPKCQQDTKARCIAGIGHIVFNCNNCGLIWDNLHQLYTVSTKEERKIKKC